MTGGGLSSFTPRHSFLARKKRFLWDTTQHTETSQKKQANVCGQTKIANFALSSSQGEATSTLMHPTTQLLSVALESIETPSSRPSFCALAQKANLAKKPSTHEYQLLQSILWYSGHVYKGMV
jgi:hypothetical protein